MKNEIEESIEKMPTYWKLATFRGFLYSLVALLTTLASGFGAYKYWHEITWIQRGIILGSGIVSMLNTIIAFLDQTMQKISPNTSSVSITATKNITADLPPTLGIPSVPPEKNLLPKTENGV